MSRSLAAVLLTVTLVVYTAALTAAQGTGQIPSCAVALAPCFQYLNATTTPPSSCCTPLTEVVTKEQKCLCGIYNNPVLIQTYHINVTRALILISLCHVDSVKDPQNLCKAIAPSASPSSIPKPSGSESASTPPRPSAAAKTTGVGLVSILLMFGAHIMFR